MIHCLDAQQIAELCGFSVATLRRRVGKGLPQNSDGTFDGPRVIAWLLQNQSAHGLDPQQEKAALNRAQRLKLEREARIAARELIPQQQVISEVGDVIGALAGKLRQLPGTLAQLVPVEVRPVVTGESRRLIVEALDDLASGTAQALAQPVHNTTEAEAH